MTNNLFDFLRMGGTTNTPPVRYRMRSVLLVLGLLLGSLNVWGDNAAVDDVLWGENFAHFGTSTPSAAGTGSGTTIWGDASISYSQDDTGTKGYAQNLAGGTSPELLLKSGNKTWTISGIPTGGATEMALSFISNKTTFAVTTSTANLSISGSQKSWTITVDEGKDTPETFVLVIKNTGSSNARIDDVALTVVTAAAGGGSEKTDVTDEQLAWSEASKTVTFGDEPYSLPSLTNTIPVSVSYQSTDETVATISNMGVVSILKAGTTTIKAIFDGDDDYNAKTISYTLTVSPAPLTPIVGGIVDELQISDFEVTGGYTAFTDKQASNAGHSNAVYAGTVARNGNSTQYNIQLNSGQTSSKLREIATSTSGGFVRRVQAIWGTKGTANTDARYLTVYGSNSAYTGSETTTSGTSLGTITFHTGDEYAYLDIDDDYPYIQIVANGAIYMDQINITWVTSAVTVAKPTISGDENFVTSTTVTISHDDADHIYYTTNGDAPTTSSAEYATPFPLTNTATVKAIAVKGSDVSAVAEKTFTKVTPMTTAAALRGFATSSAQNAYIQLDGWKVTHVSGNNAYIIDPSNEGVILNNASHGYVAGDVLGDEVVEATIKLNYGRVQLSNFTSANITATAGSVASVEITDYSTITSAHQSRLVTLKDATYSSGDGTFSDGANVIYYFDQFSASPTLVDGATYDVTGVIIYYKTNTADKVEIAPRTAADVEAKSAVVIPTAANLAALKAAERGTYILTLTNAVVSYVNGKNVFVEDGSAGALIYLDTHSFEAGNCLNGDYQVTTTTYQGKFEITAIEPQAGAATTTAAIPLTTVTIAQLNADFASYESRRIKIEGVNVTDALTTSDRNGVISDGVNTVALYAGVASTIAVEQNANIDIIGYPGFHNTDEQLTVWAQADITVNVKEDPELAWDPISATIAAGDPWSTPTFANPHSLSVTFSSDNETVATVSNTGVVALEGGLGTAVIAAHTDGDATYAAGNATYTITVNAAGTYSMSFDLTRASYDDAADAEIVWNSSVVTFTADKNDGTKVTNYLAGNYSGTTLITETRFYTKNSLSFVPQSGVTITKVEWMSTAKGYATKLAAETWTNASAEVDATDDKLVIITPTATGEFSVTLTDAARATGITVYYTAESEKAKLTASIAIADMNMAVGDEDILLSAIAATSNPNKKAISYEVTSGTAVTIEGTGAEAALHAAAAGSATITATIPDDLGNYTGATTTFAITVTAAATLESIAISGTANELEYTEGQSFNPAGLTVMGHYSNGSDAEITEGIDWTFDPDPLTEGTHSVSVTATVGEIASAAVVVNGLTVSGPAPVGDNYVKVTASQADWSGDYLLVYEDGENAYVWNGDYSDGANNYASATISSNTIAKPAAAAVITIAAASEGKYTLQVNGDKYFQDNGSNSKLIFTDAITDAAEVTISYETDWTKLLFSERCIRFNNASGQTRFRFYAASSQQAIQLYKKVTPTKEVIRGDLSAGKWGTICPKQTVENVEGATFYQISYLEEQNNLPYNVVFDQIEGTTLTAGKPYFFIAKGEEIKGIKTGAELDAADPDGVNGFYGYIGASSKELTVYNTDYNAAANNTFVIYNNSVFRINQGGTMLKSERCYININSTEPSRTAVPKNNARRRVVMGVQNTNTATGMDELNASEAPRKMIIDGKMYIFRGEKMYNANGILVK